MKRLGDTPEMDRLVDAAVDYLLRHLTKKDHWPTQIEIGTYRAGFRTAMVLAAADDMDVVTSCLAAFEREQVSYQPESVE